MRAEPSARMVLRHGVPQRLRAGERTYMDEIEGNVAGTGETFSEIDQLHLANRDLQDQLAGTRRELEAARASERLVRESRWWRIGLALKAVIEQLREQIQNIE